LVLDHRLAPIISFDIGPALTLKGLTLGPLDERRDCRLLARCPSSFAPCNPNRAKTGGRSETVDLDDCAGEALRRFLWQIVAVRVVTVLPDRLRNKLVLPLVFGSGQKWHLCRLPDRRSGKLTDTRDLTRCGQSGGDDVGRARTAVCLLSLTPGGEAVSP
jgi:hypothetical protein